MQSEKLFVTPLRQDGIMQVVLLDLRDRQQRIFAVLAGWIVLKQKLVGIDRALVVLHVEQITHGAIQRGDFIDRRRDFHRMGRNEIYTLVFGDQGLVILQGADGFRASFESLAVLFGARKLVP